MSLDEAVGMSTDVICRDPREARLLRTMFVKAGVKTRRTCVPYQTAYEWIGENAQPSESPGRDTAERMQLYSVHAGPLAGQAAVKALADAPLSGADITHLITVSCTGFDAPGVDIFLFGELGLARTTQRLHIAYMGCHGAINGLRAARGIAAADPAANILICAVELCSLHFKFQWDPACMLGNALFADGAAALVASEAREETFRVTATGSCLLPDSLETITWRIGSHGFEMGLSNRVPDLIREHLRPWLTEWLAAHGQTLDSIGSWAVHPGGPRILDAVEESLEFDSTVLDTSRAVLAEHGNMSSPTVLFILQRLLSRQAPRPCVLLGFGPGLMAEAALVE